MDEMSSKPFVLLVPSPGMGHLIPFLELANCLVAHPQLPGYSSQPLCSKPGPLSGPAISAMKLKPAAMIVDLFDKEVEGEYLDQKEPLKIPGCKPVRPEDVVKPMMNRKDPEYESFIRIGSEIGCDE
ncbi:hypothetical protein M0R45_004258 [Rubus argutus]|uniref:Uncharacterized protein n=1 Tax=Rubus argutus TaxID=59490 RepID=A0AAW1YJA7_RUBAR